MPQAGTGTDEFEKIAEGIRFSAPTPTTAFGYQPNGETSGRNLSFIGFAVSWRDHLLDPRLWVDPRHTLTSVSSAPTCLSAVN
jgi:hypothetical protein